MLGPSFLMVHGSSSLKQDIFEIAAPGHARNSSLNSFTQDSSSIRIGHCRCCRCQSSSGRIWSSVSLWPPFRPNVIIPARDGEYEPSSFSYFGSYEHRPPWLKNSAVLIKRDLLLLERGSWLWRLTVVCQRFFPRWRRGEQTPSTP
jgi:hypothetical protein